MSNIIKFSKNNDKNIEDSGKNLFANQFRETKKNNNSKNKDNAKNNLYSKAKKLNDITPKNPVFVGAISALSLLCICITLDFFGLWIFFSIPISTIIAVKIGKILEKIFNK